MLGIDNKAARATWTAACVLLGLGALYLIRDSLLVFVIALLFAYLLLPLTDFIDSRLPSKTRTTALALTFLLVIGLLVAFGAIIGSVVAAQAANLAKEAPAFIERIQQTQTGPSNTLRDQLLEALQTQLRQHYNEIAAIVPRLTLNVIAASSNLIFLVIIPILSFFMLRDGRSIRDAFLQMLDSGRDVASETLEDVHTLLLLYMRALLLLCLATFVAFSIVLTIMGVRYSMLLASIAFPLEFIPLVGPLTAGVIIVAVSAFTGFGHILWLVIFLLVYRLFQDYVLSPHLMSKGIELHPLMIIIGVFAGGDIGGVPGIFLSVPCLALIRLLYHRFRKARVMVGTKRNATISPLPR